ncbi:hypothetical protein [Halalkalicoccus salilacus]|uniref:hypothetical protein n=1 Tax=Halalkalicoccus salilacus TaxID=3117459 RepID=UPI00300EAB65
MPDGNGNEVDEANGMLIPENPPVAWSADYSSERDLTLVADQVTRHVRGAAQTGAERQQQPADDRRRTTRSLTSHSTPR